MRALIDAAVLRYGATGLRAAGPRSEAPQPGGFGAGDSRGSASRPKGRPAGISLGAAGRDAGLAAGVVALVLLFAAGCQRDKVTPQDTIFPAAVDDLTVADVTDSTVTLAWTAPGDDGRQGTASQYSIRRLDAPLADQDWDVAIQVPAPEPAAAGSRQTVVVHDLPSGQRQWFAMRTADEVPNWSLLSNDVSAVAGPPACALDPDSLDFGRVAPGHSYDLSFEIDNIGGGTLEGSVGATCGPFTVVTGDGPYRLRTGQRLEVTVRFTPDGEGEASCRLDLGLPCGSIPVAGEGAVLTTRMIPVEVGAGVTYTMGSQATELGREDDELPHPVTLTRPFLVADHEVTQGEWRSVMGWNDSRFGGADLPVEGVTWFDAVEFCNRLSLAEGLEPAYDVGNLDRDGNHIISAEVIWTPSASGYRLPTEAEWEYVCRAGTRTAFWSGEITELECLPLDPNLEPVGWYCGDSQGTTHPVAEKSANPFGLYDIHGNVGEWVWDWYDPTYGRSPSDPPEDPSIDPEGPVFGESKVARGGAWSVNARVCRSAYRLIHLPGRLYDDVGFRVVRTGS